MEELPSILLIFALIFLNGTFVAAEFSIARLRKTQVDHLAELEPNNENKHKIKVAKVLQKILANINDYISACQVGITIASLALGALAEAELEKIITPFVETLIHSLDFLPANIQNMTANLSGHGISIVLAITIITFFHVILGEIVPKNIALINPDTVAMSLAYFLKFLYGIFKAPVALLNACSDACLRIIGIDSSAAGPMHTEAELKMILSTSQEEGILEEEEEQLMQNVFEFNDTIAKDIMTPRTDMVCLKEQLVIRDAIAEINRSPHSRFPVYEGKLDNITGYVSVKDILVAVEENRVDERLEDIKAEVLKVTDGIYVIDLMKIMQTRKKQIAILIDEFGGTCGLVTIEDIVEEIFGEIEDEREVSRTPILKLANGSYIVDGLVSLKDVNEELATNFISDHYDTIGGFTYGLIGQEPREGDSVEEQGFRITVKKHGNHRIRQIKLEYIGN